MIIDESMWTDLYDHGYTSAHYYWKVQDDPAIRDKVFHDNWRTVDFVVTTIQMLTDAQSQNMTLVEETIAHSTPIARFDTGGWPVEIRKVNKSRTPLTSISVFIEIRLIETHTLWRSYDTTDNM